MSEWISVKDRMPEKNGRYLVTVAGDKITPPYVITWLFYNGMFSNFEYFPSRYITHWMPMPEPPEEDDEHAGL